MKKLLLSLIFVLPLQAQTVDQTLLRNARDQVFPALVHIQPVKEFFFSGEKTKVQVTGSGIIIRPDGYVLTNSHVAEKARQVKCTLSDKTEVSAEVIGTDPWTDLAVLKLNLAGAGLPAVPFAILGDSDKLQLGEMVLAMGSPLGLSRSLSMGVISSLDRYIEDEGEMVSPYNLWIQTDAAINPGNSGGPLVNLSGQVIGINARALIFGENLGFAIPANTARFVIDQLIRNGDVERSWLGVEWQEVNEYARYTGLKNLNGVLVAQVEPGSPADTSGLKPGDLVTAINGRPVQAWYREELPRIRLNIANLPVGSEVELTIRREDQNQTLKMITGKTGKFFGDEFECLEWEMAVEEITERVARNFNLPAPAGVLVSGVRRGGKAQEAGLERGAVLLKMDGQDIRDLTHFKELFRAAKSDQAHLLVSLTGPSQRYSLIPAGDQND